MYGLYVLLSSYKDKPLYVEINMFRCVTNLNILIVKNQISQKTSLHGIELPVFEIF